MGFNITIDDHSQEVLEQFLQQKAATLEAMGLAIEGEAKQNIEQIALVDTGRLVNSITHTTATHDGVTRRYTTDKKGNVKADHSETVSISEPDVVVVGTNVEYAV